VAERCTYKGEGRLEESSNKWEGRKAAAELIVSDPNFRGAGDLVSYYCIISLLYGMFLVSHS
jgi:hypothetical protein